MGLQTLLPPMTDSMTPYASLSETLTRVSSASSSSALWASVKDFVGRFGYTNVVAVDAGRLAAGVGGAVFYSDSPRDLLQSIDRQLVYAQHPIVLRSLSDPTPFLVSDLRNDPAQRGKPWTELLADVVKRGDGLIVPVYQGTEPRGGINYGGEKPDTSGLARGMIQVISHAAIERAMDLRNGNNTSPLQNLSVREAQCLRYVAIGHPDAEIGKILGISPRTVRFHVDSAKAKLGAATRIQAVAKALRERIIAV